MRLQTDHPNGFAGQWGEINPNGANIGIYLQKVNFIKLRRGALRDTRARNYERCEERFAARQARGVIPLHALNAWLNLEGFE